MFHFFKKTLVLAFALVALQGVNAQAQTFPGSPLRTIANITSEDANGVADSLNVQCQILGVVTSIDFINSTSLGFAISDTSSKAGVLIFTALSEPNFGYTPIIGDFLNIKGKVIQDKGLIFFQASGLTKLGTTMPPSPIVVSRPSASTESDLVAINNLQLLNPAQWPSSLGGPDATVFATNGVDSVEILIDADTDIHGTLPPTGIFHIIGIGGQRDFNFPYLGNYRILPRFTGDIKTGFGVGSNEVVAMNDFKLYPNPFKNNLFIKTQTSEPYQISISNILGQEMLKSTLQNNANISTSEFAQGVYVVQITRNGKTQTSKLICE